MSKMNQVYGIGQGLINSLPPPIKFESAPTSAQDNYEIGQVAYTGSTGAYSFYLYSGNGVWTQISDSDGPVVSVLGTAPVSVSTVAGVATVSMTGPANVTTLTNHGVVIGQGTSAMVATSAGTAGQLLTSGGASADPTWTTATFPGTVGATGTILRSNGTNWVASTDTYPNTSTAGALIAATATNVIGEIADVATGQVLMSGGVGVIPAYSGSPSVSGSLTAATTITATSGAITATNGNFVGTASGTGILLTSAQASGAASGPVIVNGRSGRVTFTSVSIAAAADLTLTLTNSSITSSTTEVMLSMSGATTGSALSIKSKTASSGSLAIVVTNGTGATTTTADIQFDFLVLNA